MQVFKNGVYCPSELAAFQFRNLNAVKFHAAGGNVRFHGILDHVLGVGLQKEIQRAKVATLGRSQVFVHDISDLIGGKTRLRLYADLPFHVESTRIGKGRRSARDTGGSGDLILHGIHLCKGFIKEQIGIGDLHRQVGIIIHLQHGRKTVFTEQHANTVCRGKHGSQIITAKVDQRKGKVQRTAVRRDQNAVLFRNQQAQQVANKESFTFSILFLRRRGVLRSEDA